MMRGRRGVLGRLRSCYQPRNNTGDLHSTAPRASTDILIVLCLSCQQDWLAVLTNHPERLKPIYAQASRTGRRAVLVKYASRLLRAGGVNLP